MTANSSLIETIENAMNVFVETYQHDCVKYVSTARGGHITYVIRSPSEDEICKICVAFDGTMTMRINLYCHDLKEFDVAVDGINRAKTIFVAFDWIIKRRKEEMKKS